RVEVIRDGQAMVPEHLSKAQDIPLAPGDRVRVRTPGGGGYGPAAERDPEAVAEDVRLGRYGPEAARRLFGWRG
ncbi:MAG: methylhydantoinase, partial [Gemmobacter sp.]